MNGEATAAAEQPKVVRVNARIAHVPTVVIGPCECGAELSTTEPLWLNAARAGKQLPPVRCGCGAVLVAKREDEKRVRLYPANAPLPMPGDA